MPRVSPYRLAAHLTSAFIIYSLILWTGLTVAMPRPPAETALQLAAAARARALAHPVAALVGVTAISGAFVAGNDAVGAHACSLLFRSPVLGLRLASSSCTLLRWGFGQEAVHLQVTSHPSADLLLPPDLL